MAPQEPAQDAQSAQVEELAKALGMDPEEVASRLAAGDGA